MENLIFSFEILGIGLLVVFASLLLLAFILIGFNKIFYRDSNKKQGKGAAGQTAQTDSSGVKTRSQTALEIASTTSQTKETSVKPEIIAASMGALLFALETPKSSFAIGSDAPASTANLWAQTGRARALSIRQDFVLLKRGKYR